MSSSQTSAFNLAAGAKHPIDPQPLLPGEGRASLSLHARTLCETGGVAALSLMLLAWAGRYFGWQLSSLAWVAASAAVTAAYVYLRIGLHVSTFLSLSLAGIFVLHPLTGASWIASRSFSMSAAVCLVPAVLLVGLVQHCQVRTILAAALGLVCGSLVGRSPDLVGVGIVGMFYLAGVSCLMAPDNKRGALLRHRLLPSLMWIVAVIGSALTIPDSWLPSSAATGEANSLAGPLAWFDRGGMLRQSFSGIPVRLTQGAASLYLGIVFIGLALIAVWPRRDNPQREDRIAAGLVVLTALALWTARGSESLHAQLVLLLQDVTLKYRTPAYSQQLLGILMVITGVFLATVTLSMARLFSATTEIRLVPTILAFSVVLLGWLKGMPEAIHWLPVKPTVAGQSFLQAWVAIGLICAAAWGLHRLTQLARRRVHRVLVGVTALAIIGADIVPLTVADVRADSTLVGSVSHSPGKQEGGRVTMSFTSEVAPSLAAPLPPSCKF